MMEADRNEEKEEEEEEEVLESARGMWGGDGGGGGGGGMGMEVGRLLLRTHISQFARTYTLGFIARLAILAVRCQQD